MLNWPVRSRDGSPLVYAAGMYIVYGVIACAKRHLQRRLPIALSDPAVKERWCREIPSIPHHDGWNDTGRLNLGKC